MPVYLPDSPKFPQTTPLPPATLSVQNGKTFFLHTDNKNHMPLKQEAPTYNGCHHLSDKRRSCQTPKTIQKYPPEDFHPAIWQSSLDHNKVSALSELHPAKTCSPPLVHYRFRNPGIHQSESHIFQSILSEMPAVQKKAAGFSISLFSESFVQGVFPCPLH